MFYTVFFAVLLLVIGMMIAKIGNRVFFVGDRATIWVMTDSMEEQIPAQSYIQIRKIEPAQIQTGDVITFYSDDPALQGQLNTHRVVQVVDGGASFVTKGDNNLAEDRYPVRADAIVGVYEKNLKGLSLVGRLFQSKLGLICIFLLTAAVTVCSFAGEPIKNLLKKTKTDASSDESK